MIAPLRPRTKNALLTLLCVGMLSIYTARVAAIYFAQRLADSSEGERRITDLERSIRLAPDDAEFPNLLGLRLSVSDQDDQRAIANLQKAVVLNPNRGFYWLDLASVYQLTRNVDKENEALQSAMNAEPLNPEISEEAAQIYLASGEPDRAFPLFKQTLEQNPGAADTILPLCWRETRNANLIFARVIPAIPRLQLAFLRLLTEQGESTAASDVWQSIVARHQSFQPQLCFFYFDYLLTDHDVAGFDRGWRALADLAPEIRAYLPNQNLIVNAGFEQPLLNFGFDWRREPADHITVGIDDKTAHSGTRSLSLSYDGNPAYDSGWKQLVPVEPDRDYDFSAWIKSADITSSSGPRLALVDAFSGANLLLTDDVLDTHPWQQIKGTLHIPSDTKLVAVRILRAPANTRIRGQVWIDDLRLVKK